MANANAPRGLVPYSDMTGKYYTGAANVYFCPAADSNNIFVGDPVLVTNYTDGNGVPAVTLATAGATNYITGCMVGVCNNAGQPVIPLLQSSPVYRVASTATYILVADDPDLLFWIQEDSVGGAIASLTTSSSSNGPSNNANLVSGSGSTITGLSGWMLQSSSVNTGSTYQMRILRALQEADNAVGNYCKWLVKVNLHSIRNATGV